MNNDYSWHFKALSNVKAGRLPTDNNPISDSDPQCGYYWVKDGRGKRVPLAIWKDEEGITVEPHQIYSKKNPDEFWSFTAEKIWTYASKHPIPYDLYQSVAEFGNDWPEEVKPKSNMDHFTDEERLKQLHQDLIIQVDEWLKTLPTGVARNQQESDKAINFANEFSRLAKEAETIHATEKAPHKAKCDEIDGKYLPVKKDSIERSKKIKQVSALYMLAEEKRRRAEAEAENAKRAAVGAPPVVAEKARSGSGSRRSSLREERAYDIVNLQELSAWVAALNPSEIDFVTCVHKIAVRHAELGSVVPGLSPPRIVTKVV
jgi:hypothetical protein